MSALLANLAARNFGRAEVVQARVPSLFEPLGRGGAGAMAHGKGPGREAMADVESNVPAVTQPERWTRSAVPVDEAEGDSGKMRRIVHQGFRRVELDDASGGGSQESGMARPAFNQITQPTEPAGEPWRAAEPRLQGSLRVSKDAKIAREIVRRSLPGEDRGRTEGRVDPARFSEGIRPGLAYNDTRSGRQVEDEAKGGVRRGLVEANALPVNERRLAGPAAEVSAASVRPPTPARAAARSVQALSASRTSEPAIQVTIGRVEVRATSVEGPVRRAAIERPRPTLSLGDFLAGRSGGSR